MDLGAIGIGGTRVGPWVLLRWLNPEGLSHYYVFVLVYICMYCTSTSTIQVHLQVGQSHYFTLVFVCSSPFSSKQELLWLLIPRFALYLTEEPKIKDTH